MRLPSVGQYSWFTEGYRAVLPILIYNPNTTKMKYVVFFLLVVVAVATAAPQLVAAWPGFAAGYPYAARTLVAGPTVVNGAGVYGARYIAPGYVGPAIF